MKVLFSDGYGNRAAGVASGSGQCGISDGRTVRQSRCFTGRKRNLFFAPAIDGWLTGAGSRSPTPRSASGHSSSDADLPGNKAETISTSSCLNRSSVWSQNLVVRSLLLRASSAPPLARLAVSQSQAACASQPAVTYPVGDSDAVLVRDDMDVISAVLRAMVSRRTRQNSFFPGRPYATIGLGEHRGGARFCGGAGIGIARRLASSGRRYPARQSVVGRAPGYFTSSAGDPHVWADSVR
jgi:hypothetical protein